MIRSPILIVEDDEATQLLLRVVLKRCGFASDVASNGREAIALLQSRTYSAVILDVMMPEVSGRDVVHYLSTTAHPLPVIICSAAGPNALEGFDSSVVKAIVRKPFDVDHFVAIVTQVAQGQPKE